MGAAPRLAGIITRRPHVFDGLLDPALLAELPEPRLSLRAAGTSFLENSVLYEDILDRLRIFASEQKFLIGVRAARRLDRRGARQQGVFRPRRPDDRRGARGRAGRVRRAPRRGCRAARVVILGMGKLGSRELTAGSDVDLILLYDHDADAEESDGDKPLAAVPLLRAADAAPDRRGFGADRRGRALRARSAAASVRQQGPGRHPYRRLQEVPARARPGPGSTWR